MPDDRFFIVGDLFSNILCAAIAALIAYGIIDSDWAMLPAMLVGMLTGMGATLILAVLILMRSFGAMEIMLPTMLAGMVSGMWVAMRAAMQPLTLLDALAYGILIGIATLALCWTANAQLKGRQPHG